MTPPHHPREAYALMRHARRLEKLVADTLLLGTDWKPASSPGQKVPQASANGCGNCCDHDHAGECCDDHDQASAFSGGRCGSPHETCSNASILLSA